MPHQVAVPAEPRTHARPTFRRTPSVRRHFAAEGNPPFGRAPFDRTDSLSTDRRHPEVLFLPPGCRPHVLQIGLPLAAFVVASSARATNSEHANGLLLASSNTALPALASGQVTARLLLAAHSQAVAFESPVASRPRLRADGHSPSQISDGLRPNGHVVSRCYPTAPHRMSRAPRPSIVSAGLKLSRASPDDFSRQKLQAPGYPPVGGFSLSAPSPLGLTGKRLPAFRG